VRSFGAFDDGAGLALFAGGKFESAGGIATHSLARWDGSAWSAFGAAANEIEALAVFDEGSGGGPALFAGGYAGGPFEFLHVARRSGAGWAGLGTGRERRGLGAAGIRRRRRQGAVRGRRARARRRDRP
jgi:hypothetical protein